jgi:hypothetical protein
MAYDEALAARVRAALRRRRGIGERPMFGGRALRFTRTLPPK